MKAHSLIAALLSLISYCGFAQFDEDADNPTIAVLSMDSKGIDIDNIPMGNLVRLELIKTQKYEVLDKYDVAHEMEESGIDQSNCFGKNQLTEAGKILKSDYMLTGSVEKFGDKLIYTLRLVDVEKSKIEKTTVLEFVYQMEDIQTMTTIIINDLLDIPNDPHKMELLVSFERPITNNRSSLNLSGPRFGVQYFTGDMADRLTAKPADGGFDMNYPITSTFGYQWETQYISAGRFQALFEFIPSVNGIESGTPSFSFTVMHGMRIDGWEFGFGPSFRLLKLGKGYYDNNDQWHLESEAPSGTDVEIVERLDSRGVVKLNTGLVLAGGYTFTSGYLNFPVNFYWSPSPNIDSNVFGLVLGFNIAKTPMRQIPND